MAERRGRIPRANFWWDEGLPTTLPASVSGLGVGCRPPRLWLAGFPLARRVPRPGDPRDPARHPPRVRQRPQRRRPQGVPLGAACWISSRMRVLSDSEAADLEPSGPPATPNDSINDQEAFRQLDELARKYPGSRRVHRMKVELCRKRAENTESPLPRRVEWAERVMRLEPEQSRWRNLRRRLLRDAVRREQEADRWLETVDRAAYFAEAYPDVHAPETDLDHLLRCGVRHALASGDEPIAVALAGRLRDRHPEEPEQSAARALLGRLGRDPRLLRVDRDWPGACRVARRLNGTSTRPTSWCRRRPAFGSGPPFAGRHLARLRRRVARPGKPSRALSPRPGPAPIRCRADPRPHPAAGGLGRGAVRRT